MAKLKCPCGNVLSNVLSPNETEGVLLKDYQLDFDGTLDCFQIMDTGREVWECAECGRLAFSFPGKNDSTVKWYSPDDGAPGGLMHRDR